MSIVHQAAKVIRRLSSKHSFLTNNLSVEVPQIVEQPKVTPISISSQIVAIVVGGPRTTQELIVNSTCKALINTGFERSSIAVTIVDDTGIIPFVVKRITNEHNFKLVIVVASLQGDQNFCQSFCTSLRNIGLERDIPVIAETIDGQSQLETNAREEVID